MGDRPAFERIVRSRQSLIFSIALHFLRSRALAEEIAQEVFLELYRARNGITTLEHLDAWLRRTTLHRCIDESRRKAYRMELPLDLAEKHGQSDEAADFLATEQLRDLVAGLPETHRAAVVLRYLEDMEPAEIATLLSIPVNTVKSRIARALSLLRRRMERKVAARA